MYKTKQKIVLLITLLSSTLGIGQQLNNSPYTRYGLGELSLNTTAAYFGLGGASVAYSEYNHVNLSNPASYSSLIKYKPVFDVGMLVKMHQFKTQTSSTTESTAALKSFTLALPVFENTGIAFGLMPYSTVGYDINSYDVLNGDSVRYNYNGKGGVNKVFLGAGRELYNKNDSTKVSLGFNVAYLFGTIENSRSVIYNDATFYNSKINNYKTVSGFNFDVGLHFQKVLNQKQTIQIGVDYGLGNTINATKDFYAYNFKYSYSNIVETAKDTIDYAEDIKGEIYIPSNVKIGVALILSKKTIISAEYASEAWSTYSEKYGAEELNTSNLSTSSKYSIGLSYTPTLMKDWNSKTKNVFQKSTYRFGARLANTNLIVNNTVIKDYGISFGISVPLLSSRSFSSLDLGMDLGKTGTIDSGLIEDNYFRIHLGFSLAPTNYDRWFRKRKYD